MTLARICSLTTVRTAHTLPLKRLFSTNGSRSYCMSVKPSADNQKTELNRLWQKIRDSYPEFRVECFQSYLKYLNKEPGIDPKLLHQIAWKVADETKGLHEKLCDELDPNTNTNSKHMSKNPYELLRKIKINEKDFL